MKEELKKSINDIYQSLNLINISCSPNNVALVYNIYGLLDRMIKAIDDDKPIEIDNTKEVKK